MDKLGFKMSIPVYNKRVLTGPCSIYIWQIHKGNVAQSQLKRFLKHSVLKNNYARNCGCYQSLILWILVPIDVQRRGGKIAFVFEVYSSGML
jgi:hypothetical protein